METNRTALAGRHDVLLGSLAFFLIALLIFLSIYLHRPPPALSADASPAQFSAERAMKDLMVIAERPHPIGSAENAKVAAYITQRLSALGLEPDVRNTTVVNRLWGNPYPAATVQNIVARVKGKEGGKAVLLAAHYDSVPGGPGASDDGAAAASLLEVARALKSLPPLKNDLIFLFTDGEEAGLLGATAFVKEHPWARDVGLALNFEARGNSGPVYMFETSPQNGWLIQEFAKAAPHSFTSSLMYDIYKILPNDTDLTVFKEAGLPALNFANIKNVTHYHTRLDSLESVDQRTLQQKGSTCLALASHFGNLDLENAKRANATYFDISGLTIIYYSAAWTIPLAVLTLVVFVAVSILGRRRTRLTLRGVAPGILSFVLSVAISSVLVTLIWGIAKRTLAEYRLLPASGSYHGLYFFIGFMALTAAIFLSVGIFAQRRVKILDLWMGALFGWLLLMIASVFYLPGASYLLTWPLLFSLLALGSLIIARQPYRIGRVVVFSVDSHKQSSEEFISLRQLIVLSICAIPAIMLWVPVIYMIYLAIELSNTLLLVILAGTLLGAITPHLILMTKHMRWLLPGTLALAAVGCLVAGGFKSGFDAQHPKPNSIFYGLDADKNEARFLSTDATEDEWTSTFFSGSAHRESAPAFFPQSDTQLLQGPAPVTALPAPGITLLEDSTTNNVRSLRLRITSPRRAPIVSVSIDNEVLAASVDGQEMSDDKRNIASAARSGLAFRFYALGEAGIELSLRVRPEAVKIRAVDISYGLPVIPGVMLKPRPEYMMTTAIRTFAQNSTMVSKSFTF